MVSKNLYSKRLAAARRSGCEVYTYDELPKEFCNQVMHIWNDAIGAYQEDEWDGGPDRDWPPNDVWQFIHDKIAREHGQLDLSQHKHRPDQACADYLHTARTERRLDLIQLSFFVIDSSIRKFGGSYEWERVRLKCSPDQAIRELNERFLEHGLGFQYEEGLIIRFDSRYLHAEAVVPAIQLLGATGFSGPKEEFLTAHKHYRHGNEKEAIAEALKAFESTMKSIADLCQWPYSTNDAAKQLIAVMFDNQLIPASLQSQFSALRSVLEAGVPTVRNKMGGHGQGSTPVKVPDHLAAYALHMTASNIVFLIESYKSLSR